MRMRIDEALQEAMKMLRDVERPRLEAEILLAHILGKERIYLHAHPDAMIEAEPFFALVRRRAEGEPVEYLTGKVSFYGEEFHITPGVLIPRPETEILVEKVAKELRGTERVAEIGTGSGVIAIMLKKLLPDLQIIATDINPKAIELAKKNAALHDVEIEFRLASYIEGITEPIDAIVSNPPYIKRGYKLPKSVRYEPQNALFGGEEGDEVLRRIVTIFADSDAKLLACEMGYDQRAPMQVFMRSLGLEPKFYRDLAGLDRGFIVRK